MSVIVIFGGRFQPFHRGHKAVYNKLMKKFPKFPVYIASAEKPPGTEDPFTWDEKQKLAKLAGIPSEKFIKVPNVYSGTAIKEALDLPNDTIIIMAVSEKDKNRIANGEIDENGMLLNKNGEPSAIQKLSDNLNKLTPRYSYVTILPTVEFTILGKEVVSASEIRNTYRNVDEKGRDQLLTDLYGKTSPLLHELFNKRLVTPLAESILREFKDFIYRESRRNK